MNALHRLLTAGTLALAAGSITAGALLTSSAIAAPDGAPKATITQIIVSPDGTTNAFKCQISVPEVPVPALGGAWLPADATGANSAAGAPAPQIVSSASVGESGVAIPAPADASGVIVGAGQGPDGSPLNAINITGSIDDIRDGTPAECAAVPGPSSLAPAPGGAGGAAG